MLLTFIIDNLLSPLIGTIENGCRSSSLYTDPAIKKGPMTTCVAVLHMMHMIIYDR